MKPNWSQQTVINLTHHNKKTEELEQDVESLDARTKFVARQDGEEIFGPVLSLDDIFDIILPCEFPIKVQAKELCEAWWMKKNKKVMQVAPVQWAEAGKHLVMNQIDSHGGRIKAGQGQIHFGQQDRGVERVRLVTFRRREHHS